MKVVSNNAVWVLPGLLFVACLWYLLSFYPHAPAEWSALQVRQAYVDQAALDAKTVEQTQTAGGALLSTLKTAHIAYADFMDSVNQNQKLPSSEVLGSTMQKIAEAKSQGLSSIQALEATHSSNADVEAYAHQIASDLKIYPPLLDEMAKTMKLAQQGDQATVISQVAAQQQMMNQWPPALQKTDRQMAGFSGILPLSPETQSTAEQVLQADRKQFLLRFYLAVAAVLYMLVFAVLLGQKLVLSQRGEQVRPVNAAKGRRRRK
jgi:hypothetical protein